MTKNRTRLDIVADVLRAAKVNCKKTRIMYFANLSHTLVERYLRETISVGMISFAGNRYQVTDKGEAFLEKYSNYLGKRQKADGQLRILQFEKTELERMCGGEDRNKAACLSS